VLEAAPGRIEPRCRHYTQCGGCHYQHLTYDAQLEAKRDILRDQLARIGKIPQANVLASVPASPWNYRNHVQFHLTGDGKLGYHAAGSGGVIPIQECHLPESTINTIWPQLDFEALPELERIGLRLGAGDDLQLVLDSYDPRTPELTVEDLPISVVHLSPAGPLVLAGSESIVIEVLERPFRVSAGAFFQVNTLMAGKMVAHLLERLPLQPDSTVLELYCGVGLFSAFIAPRVARLVGVESSTYACDDFVVNLDEYENVELYQAQAGQVLPQLDLNPEIVLVDPPREGLDRATLDGILALQPNTLAYVSCDPATLARDARRLSQAGYQLLEITPFDLFPQTYHIESISLWQPADNKDTEVNMALPT
jgi:23S rRNA (uracil1939-C5)-methyltransferase